MRYLSTVLGAVFCLGAAQAGTVTVVETITTSGSLSGTPFTNSLVTFTLQNDFSAVGTSGPDFSYMPGTLQVHVDGVGTAFLAHEVVALVDQASSWAGFSDKTNSLAILLTRSQVLTSCTLSASCGPYSGESVGNPGTAFSVGSGSLILSGPLNVDHPSTLTITVDSSVPEPGSVLLLGSGLGLLALARRARR